MQRLYFIDAVLNSIVSKAYLPMDRADSIHTIVAALLPCAKALAITIQCLLGDMAASVAVLPIAKCRMRPLLMSFLRQF